ncbi:MAG: protein-tyrosine phosphatase family protein [Actinomycetota bacterium]
MSENIDTVSPEEWGVPDFDGPAHKSPIRGWSPLQRSFLPTCRHWREPVDLREGITVFASAWFDRPYRKKVDMDWPEVGFYLDGSWASAELLSSPGFRPPFVGRGRTRIVIYPWPDLGLPRDPRRFTRALRWLLEEAARGRRVEIGCAGGHGRTGTTLAGLLVLQGLTPRGAIRRVRRSYCDEAVESRDQAEMLRRFA